MRLVEQDALLEAIRDCYDRPIAEDTFRNIVNKLGNDENCRLISCKNGKKYAYCHIGTKESYREVGTLHRLSTEEIESMVFAIYTTNSEGVQFTLQEAFDFANGRGYHGNYGCHYCPYNHGHERGASYIVGPCGQQVCFVETIEY